MEEDKRGDLQHSVGSPICNDTATILVRQSQEFRDIGRRIAPLWQVLEKIQTFFGKDADIVAYIDVRSQTLNVADRMELFFQCSNLLLLTTISFAPSPPKHLSNLFVKPTLEGRKPQKHLGMSWSARRVEELLSTFLVAVAGVFLHVWSSDYGR